MTDHTPPETVRAAIVGDLDLCLNSLRALDEVAGSPLPSEIRARTIDAVLDQTAAIDAETFLGTGARSGPQLDHAAPYLGLLNDENAARRFLGMAPNPVVESLPDWIRRGEALPSDLAGFARALAPHLSAELRLRPEMVAADVPPRRLGPRFSEAAELKKKEMGDAVSREIPVRKAPVFIAIVGDLHVGEIKHEHLEKFAQDFVLLDPGITRGRMPSAEVIRANIESNRSARKTTRSKTTIKDYLLWIRMIVREGCSSAEIACLLGEKRVRISKDAVPAQKRQSPDRKALNSVFACGVGSGILTDAILGPLGLIAGRRIGLLADIHGQDIVKMNGVWVVVPSHTVIDGDGIARRVPFKSEASLGVYVLHSFFDETGFIAFARSSPGPVFTLLSKTNDPADAAASRYSRLVSRSGVDKRIAGTFHHLRHGCIAWMEDEGVKDRVSRLQAGHEHGNDVHARYKGNLSPDEMQLLSNLPLPRGIDWDMYGGLDWEALAAKRSKGGRPPRSAGQRGDQ